MKPLLLLTPLFLAGAASAFAEQPIEAVREHSGVLIASIEPNTQTFSVTLPPRPGGGVSVQSVHVGPKTWIIKDNEDAKFTDLRVGQRVRLSYIPRGALAVIVTVLPQRPAHGPAAQPVYAVREYFNVPITSIDRDTRSFTVALPAHPGVAGSGGAQSLKVGPKTWIIKDNHEARFESLRVGQRIRLRCMSRGDQAVTVQVLAQRPPPRRSSRGPTWK